MLVKPDLDLKGLGVDFTGATKDGLRAAYQHGENKGKEFISMFPSLEAIA
ncbi:hypothetical protein QUB80_18795 [Chlorogloeopsis sp. ULAP01]|nr:hypothetical protein [Chlorogloeopsis sp. ULAP01]MDM9382744.1 hypothetical protein [Chlorogloeopsis sp. ULAP01]